MPLWDDSRRAVARTIGRARRALLMVAIAIAPATAAPQDAPLPRTILALYDGTRESTPDQTRIHRYAEVVLNYLGYAVTYRNIRGRLPPPSEIQGYAALLTWFAAPLEDNGSYLSWAKVAAPMARRLIVLGSVGGAFWTNDAGAMNAILGVIGLEHERRIVELTLGTEVSETSPRLTQFEREQDPIIPPYEVVRAVRADVEAWLRLTLPVHERAGTSVAVGVSPRGGYAAMGFEIVEDLGHGRVRWLIDPFTFFGRILSPEPWPVPDVTTVSGRRLAFSHVEGDGLNDVVEIDGSKVLLAARFLSEIVEAYPDVPVTFALTPGDLDPDLGGNATPRDLVKRIWGAPQVEASVASYTRPYRWSFFETYSRDRELAAAAKAHPTAFSNAQALARPAPTEEPRAWSVGRAGDYPRNYIARPFSLREEIDAAAAAARALLPEGKSLRLFQWTGDASPYEEAIAATRHADLLNINGGESRFDQDYPSVGHLPPLARPVGVERQIYAVGADEYPLRKAWRPVTAALRGLGDTLARTEWPRRLKPLDLHYHLASLSIPEALTLIRRHVAALREATLAPVSASLYAAMVEGFFSTTVTPRAGGGWRIADRGAIETVRLDAPSRRVDLSRSRGVLGQTRHGGVIYVALDPAVEPAEVVLEPTRGFGGGGVGLTESRWRLSHLSREAWGWSFEARGFGPGMFSFEDVPAGAYRVTAGQGEAAWSTVARAEVGGLLSFVVPRNGQDGLVIRVRRIDSEERQGD